MIQSRPEHELPTPATGQPFLRWLRIKNYKSIAICDISPGPLTILVGRNGAGKSNILDALRFVSDGLQNSLDLAIKTRGGIDAVRRKSTGHPRNFAIDMKLTVNASTTADYDFEIAAGKKGSFVVKQERLAVFSNGRRIAHYTVGGGELVHKDRETMPPAAMDRLYLVNAAGLPEFRPVYDMLLSMGFYNLNPEEMKAPRQPDAGELLHHDGGNIPSVIARLRSDNADAMNRILAYLSEIVPGIEDVERKALGSVETLEFRQSVAGSQHPWRFDAQSMSDGTLRALGALVAVMQLADRSRPVSLVGIEEPETALHPAAAGALMGALRDAAQHTQIIVTSHSPDLLNETDLSSESLFVVQSDQGSTRVAPIDQASRKAIRKHLVTPGELLRNDQLEPDAEDLNRQNQQLRLAFEAGSADE
jgi:predicted ATPase